MSWNKIFIHLYTNFVKKLMLYYENTLKYPLKGFVSTSGIVNVFLRKNVFITYCCIYVALHLHTITFFYKQCVIVIISHYDVFPIHNNAVYRAWKVVQITKKMLIIVIFIPKTLLFKLKNNNNKLASLCASKKINFLRISHLKVIWWKSNARHCHGNLLTQ